ncbi:hypothetical protein TUM4438_45340 [Shewanella sairae]|uniref:Uncharacterized protein n=1 Tax=Shewanella sairae TaxID=190310 RepID=A0ABQ4PS25_9GAMM|nr:DUF6572 domain-containing protein [Shewanella sairae]MCL1132577.1 hypothetical protein [Shewanella sairae]GIU52484.1 hypothetical protein TUM4438_45340 [Shewanella sairae]
MTIMQEDVIDLFYVNEEENYISLIISDHLEWDEKNEKLLLLQRKINTYLAYLESGQVYETNPESKDMNVYIALTSMYAPNEEALKFFRLLVPIVEDAGFHFKWSVA